MDSEPSALSTSQQGQGRRQMVKLVKQPQLRETLEAKRKRSFEELAVVDTQLDARKRTVVAYDFPARRLPFEVISMIIVFHTRDNHGSLLRVMLVCKAWNAAARLAGELWSTIGILCHEPRHQRNGGELVAGTNQQFLNALEASEGLALGIQFHHRISEEALKQIFKDIDKLHPPLRVRSLKVTRIEQPVATLFESWDLNGLEEIETNDDHLLARAVVESHKLTALSVKGSHLQQFQTLDVWGRLRNLDISKADSAIPLRVLSKCTSLVNLTLEGCQLEQQANRVVMPQLRYLYLSSCTPFWPIDCPNMVDLRINYHGGLDTTIQYIPLPSLRRFVYTGTNAGSQLLLFKIPNVENLRIASRRYTVDPKDDTNILSQLWIDRIQDERFDPPVLTLSSIQVDQKILVEALATLTRCVKLCLSDVVLSVEFFKAFQSKARRWTRSNRIILKNLEHLEIDISGGRKVNLPALVKKAREFASSRKAAGVPLRRLSIGYEEINLTDGQ